MDYRQLAIMNADGSGVSQVGGVAASDLAWLPDGARIGIVQDEEGMACPADGRICPPAIMIVNADGTGAGHYGYRWNPPGRRRCIPSRRCNGRGATG